MCQLLHIFLSLKMIILIIHQPVLLAEPLKGYNIHPAKIPFIASFAIDRSDLVTTRAHICTGSLIAPKLVLTAAHCFANVTYEQVNVVIGADDLRGAKPKYRVYSWTTFERWAARKQPSMLALAMKDIAVVALRASVRGVTPANITTLASSDLYGKNAKVIGWEAAGSLNASRFLREAQVRIPMLTECEQRFHFLTGVPDRFPKGALCTVANPHGPYALLTEGDSGGPLLDESNNILAINVGVCPTASLFYCTEHTANPHRFNLHVDLISEYRQFIDDVKAHFEHVLPNAHSSTVFNRMN